jgi:hypothetical protein
MSIKVKLVASIRGRDALHVIQRQPPQSFPLQLLHKSLGTENFWDSASECSCEGDAGNEAKDL